jgi:exonuclease III
MNNIHKNSPTLVKIALAFITALCFVFGCSTRPQKNTSPSETPIASVSKATDEISVMTFNVENLFDTVHDEGTEDYTNLPLSEKQKPEVQKFCSEVKIAYYRSECFTKNWDADALKFKLSQLSKVIRNTDAGKGPDSILMAEVENQNVLNQLVKTQLNDLGYQTIVVIEGPDLRGIDPAFISKFPLAEKPKLHLIPYTDSNPEQLKHAKRSRGILEVTVVLPNKKNLTFLIGHFPSQASPTAWRKQASEFATKKMLELASENKAVIMGGDLNITADEEDSSGYFSKIFSTAGQVSHLVGCKNCEGSHFYKGHWSFLDVQIFGNKIDQAGLKLIPESITVLKTAVHMKRNGTPLRFNEQKKEGVSDHFPLYSRLKIKF